MIGDALAFLFKHLDIVELIYDAIVNRGVDRAKLVAAIKQEMVQASVAKMKDELG